MSKDVYGVLKHEKKSEDPPLVGSYYTFVNNEDVLVVAIHKLCGVDQYVYYRIKDKEYGSTPYPHYFKELKSQQEREAEERRDRIISNAMNRLSEYNQLYGASYYSMERLSSVQRDMVKNALYYVYDNYGILTEEREVKGDG